ncbi:major capsid protein [Winogradskyella phage Peternella_1]|uniref:Major capsid protein n=1 Tax=Winogradskyella phage Peternella_1 TaxID=2745699 RepID=A0A8E4ZL75_9CAUD|nr:major capsid protein [Winogradskyella phage Peternella_1]QQV91576.1 major capsid protein [Winogradskyella phage Peternella_1]
MKNFFKCVLAILIIAVVSTVGHAFGATSGETVSMAVTTVALPIKNELAEREMIKALRHEHTWVSEIRSKQNWVNNDVIKIPKRGAAPKVLIDNTNYPIVSNNRDDSHVIVALHKFDTENTTVTDDELYALPYEKVSDVQMQHRETLEDETMEYGLWGLAPLENDETENQFVMESTGEDDGTGRKKLQTKDLRTLQAKMNKKGINKKGRILILCDDHVSDLLEEDRKFYTQYHNQTNGVVSNKYYGFKIYEDSTTPEYDDTSLEKLAYGSATTGRTSSVVFHKGSTAKAAGTVKRYAKAAKDNPEMRENTIGFRLHHIIVAYGIEGSAAIISGKTA